MYTVEQAPRELNFGRQGESNILSYQFDFSQWAADWPDGGASMTATLPNQTQAWPIPVEQAVVDGTVITLYVQDNLTAKEGRGTLIIRYEAGPNKKRSRVIEFMVEKGHAPAGPAPDPVEDWIADANVKIGEVDKSLVSANAAEGLRDSAETARETAEGLRAGAETSRNTAEGLRVSAETARNSAEGLRDSAETSRKEAEALRVAADAARMGFKPMGAYNPTNENKYGEWYTHEGGSYGYIWPEPSTGVPLTDTTHWQQIASQGPKGDVTPEAEAARDAAEGYRDEASSSASAAALSAPNGSLSVFAKKDGAIIKRVPTVAVGDGGSYSDSYPYTMLNKDTKQLSGNSTVNGAWIDTFSRTGNAENKPYVDVDMPFGVVIGDSIAEGHPGLHGRLDAGGTGAYDDDLPNVPGQLSYELGELTGMYWYNHGIGSQETTSIWTRWARDVLGETYNPGDGRGSSTLPRKAYAVWVHAGINDIFQSRTDAYIQANYILMAESARDNGIICIFNNIGENSLADATQRAQILRVNAWMAANLPNYGAYVADYYTWSKEPGADTVRADGLMSDYVHPTTAGYQGMAQWILSKVPTAPISYVGLYLGIVVSLNNTPGSYRYTRNLRVKIIPAAGQTEVAQEFRFLLQDAKREQLVKIKPNGYGYKARLILDSTYSTTNYCGGFSDVSAAMGCLSNSENPGLAIPQIPAAFTPWIYGSSTTGTNTYSAAQGTYQLIGNVLFFSLLVAISSKDAAMAGNIRVATFPVRAVLTTSYIPVTVGQFSGITPPAGATLGVIINNGANDAYLVWNKADGSAAHVTHAELGATPSISLQGWYFV